MSEATAPRSKGSLYGGSDANSAAGPLSELKKQIDSLDFCFSAAERAPDCSMLRSATADAQLSALAGGQARLLQRMEQLSAQVERLQLQVAQLGEALFSAKDGAVGGAVGGNVCGAFCRCSLDKEYAVRPQTNFERRAFSENSAPAANLLARAAGEPSQSLRRQRAALKIRETMKNIGFLQSRMQLDDVTCASTDKVALQRSGASNGDVVASWERLAAARRKESKRERRRPDAAICCGRSGCQARLCAGGREVADRVLVEEMDSEDDAADSADEFDVFPIVQDITDKFSDIKELVQKARSCEAA